jgi:hypothetical protein
MMLMQRQQLKRALPVMLPPGADDWTDEIRYVCTAEAEQPQIDLGPDYAPRGPAALIAVMPSARLPWVWARAFKLTDEAEMRRERERLRAEGEAREAAHAAREKAIQDALAALHVEATGQPWPGSMKAVRLPERQAMCRARKISPSASSDALADRLTRWAAESVGSAGGVR